MQNSNNDSTNNKRNIIVNDNPPTPDLISELVPPTSETFDKDKVSGTFNGQGANSTIGFEVALDTAEITNGTFTYNQISGTNGSGEIEYDGDFEIKNFVGEQLKTPYEIEGTFDNLSSGTYSLYQETGSGDLLLDTGIFTNFALDPKNIEGIFSGKGDFSTLDFIVDLNTAEARDISFTFDNKDNVSLAGGGARAVIGENGFFSAVRFSNDTSELNGVELKGAFGSLTDGSYILSVSQAGASIPLTDSGKFSKK